MNPLITCSAHEARRYGALRPRPQLVNGIVIETGADGTVSGAQAQTTTSAGGMYFPLFPHPRPAFPWFLPLAELAAAREDLR